MYSPTGFYLEGYGANISGNCIGELREVRFRRVIVYYTPKHTPTIVMMKGITDVLLLA